MKKLFKVVDMNKKAKVLSFFERKIEAKKLRDEKNDEYLKIWLKEGRNKKEEDFTPRFVISRGPAHWRGETFGRKIDEDA